MKPITNKLLKIIPLVNIGLSAILLIVAFFIKDIPENKSYFYQDNKVVTKSWHDVFELFSEDLFLTIFFVSITLTIICIVVRIKFKNKVKKYLLLIWTSTAICFLIIFFSDVSITGIQSDIDYSPMYYKYTDGNHTIVIEERSFLLYGGGIIYQVNDNNEAIILNSFTTDDGGRNKGKYDIEWYNDYAKITFNTFNTSTSKNTIKIIFSD